VSSDTDAPSRRKKSFLYNHLHILLDHLCKFERNPPDSLGGDDLGDVRMDVQMDGRKDECNSLPHCGGIKKWCGDSFQQHIHPLGLIIIIRDLK
jgi:hypothetical protein